MTARVLDCPTPRLAETSTLPALPLTPRLPDTPSLSAFQLDMTL